MMEDYFDTMQDLGLKLCRLLAEGLGLEPEIFAKSCSGTMSTLKLVRYIAEVLIPKAIDSVALFAQFTS